MKNLKDIREEKGLTQPALSILILRQFNLEISVSTIWRAEQGKQISRLKAKAICRGLDVELKDVKEFAGMPITGEHKAVTNGNTH